MNVGIFDGNSTDVAIKGFCLAQDGTPINDATITVTVYEATLDANGDVVQGSAVANLSDIPANYVGGSNGNYRARLPAADIPAYGTSLLVVATCTSHGCSWSLPGKVRLRG